MLPAAELVPSGFVTRVVRPDALVEAVDAVVTTISSKTPAASRRLKEALLNAAVHMRDAALEREYALDRKSVWLGKSVAVRVDLGGRRIMKNKKYRPKMTQN